MQPHNLTHVVDNPNCDFGLGCLFRSINDVGGGLPYLTLFTLIYVVITFGLVNSGNNFVKSFTTSTFVMLLIALVSIPAQVVTEQILIGVIIALSVLSAINIYLMRSM